MTFEFKPTDNYTDKIRMIYIRLSNNITSVRLYKDNMLTRSDERTTIPVTRELAKQDMINLLLTGQIK